MKKMIVGIFLITVSFSALAANNCSVIGFHEPGTHTYDGPTWCEKVNFDNVIVRGPLQVDSSRIGGLVDVSGPVTASKSQFNSIQIENNFTAEKITLNNNTEVKGNIVFLGPKGTVMIDPTSKVIGSIINGNVKKP